MIARFIMGALALSILTACETFTTPLGADLDEGGFGNPTMQNISWRIAARSATWIIYLVMPPNNVKRRRHLPHQTRV